MNTHLPKDQDEKKRVLLMYISKVSGHRQATVAIQEGLRQLCPGIKTPAINGFSYIYPRLEKFINKAYMSVIKRTPFVWDYMYDNPKIVKKSESLKKFLHKSSHKKLEKLFAKYHSDTVVCTQAFPCGMVADYKVSHKLNITLIGVLTDFTPHAYWVNEGVDYYIVPSLEAKERLENKGVAAEAIRVFGIPIRPKFSKPVDRKAIAATLGLDPKIPTLLIMGGGQGLGPIKDIVKSLLKVEMNFQAIVLAGRNKKIIGKLQDLVNKSNKKIIVCEYATNVDELMGMATLIITKPGGMTTAESLAKGLPMVIVDPIPGQEARNTDFLLKNGVAIRVDHPKEVGEEVQLILKSPEKLLRMKEAALAHAKPDATFDIAKLILNASPSFRNVMLNASP